MFDKKIKPQTLLSTLWVFVLLNMFLRDFHEFPTEGFIEGMMAMKIPEETMLFYAFLGEIPILMVLFSRILNNRANKWANLIAVIVSSLGILYTLPQGHLDEIFFAIVNGIALLSITRISWKLSDFETPETLPQMEVGERKYS